MQQVRIVPDEMKSFDYEKKKAAAKMNKIATNPVRSSTTTSNDASAVAAEFKRWKLCGTTSVPERKNGNYSKKQLKIDETWLSRIICATVVCSAIIELEL